MATGVVLYVEDDRSLWPIVQEQCLASNFDFVPACSGAEGFDLALRVNPAAVLLDLNLPDLDGFAVMRSLRLRNCRAPVVVVTSFGGPQVQRDAFAAGAAAYVEKPLAPNLVRDEVLGRVVKAAPASAQAVIVGHSPALEEVLRLAAHLAPTDISVLIDGESGTGKELFAQVIHQASPRRHKPFVVFDPSSVPETLLESALFGHERGAFTGAVQSAQGVFEVANGGTLVIDEIGNLPIALQGKLLRVLQDHRLSPLGAARQIEIDVRVLASTNADLGDLVARGTFRLDLFHRLKGANLHLPALRERAGDIELLANHFLAQHNRSRSKTVSEIAPSALAMLRNYSWPGNIRELGNAIAYAHSMAQDAIMAADLPPEIRANQNWNPSGAGLLDTALLDRICDEALRKGKLDLKRLIGEVTASLELQLLGRLLRGRSQAALASMVGLDPATVSRKLRGLGLTVQPPEPEPIAKRRVS